MGEAKSRGTFEQRKNKPNIMPQEKETAPIALEDSSRIIADAVNKVVKAGAMPPYVIAILELIKIDLALQHMSHTNKVQEAVSKMSAPKIEDNSGN